MTSVGTLAQRLGITVDGENVTFTSTGHPRVVATIHPTTPEQQALAVFAGSERVRFAIETEPGTFPVIRTSSGTTEHLRDFAVRRELDPNEFSEFVNAVNRTLTAGVAAVVASLVAEVNDEGSPADSRTARACS